MPDVFAPLTHLLARVLASCHALVGALGLAGGAGWLVALGLLVVAIRTALLPLAIRSARNARAMAAAAPGLRALQRQYAGRRDRESLQRLADDRRLLLREHGVAGVGLAPMLLQLPLMFSMYHVVTALAAGRPLGALDAAVVTAASGATLCGAHLSTRLVSASGLSLPTLTLALLAAACTFVSMHAAAPADGVQRLLPVLSAVGVLVGACFVPTGLIAYWAVTNLWTLGQQAAFRRLFAHTTR